MMMTVMRMIVSSAISITVRKKKIVLLDDEADDPRHHHGDVDDHLLRVVDGDLGLSHPRRAAALGDDWTMSRLPVAR